MAVHNFTVFYTKNIERSLRFYGEGVLGLSSVYRWPAAGPSQYVCLRSPEVVLWVVAKDLFSRIRRPPWVHDLMKSELHIEAEDVDNIADQLVEAGGTLISATWSSASEKSAVIEDPDGNRIHLRTKTENEVAVDFAHSANA